MQVSFTCRLFDASDELKELLRSKLEKRLDRLVKPGTAETRVLLATEKAWTVLDVQVTAWGEVFKAAEKTTDLYPTIDLVVDKLERQLQKHKELLHDRRTRRPTQES
jgi:putative sigma-54 modulation protein